MNDKVYIDYTCIYTCVYCIMGQNKTTNRTIYVSSGLNVNPSLLKLIKREEERWIDR